MGVVGSIIVVLTAGAVLAGAGGEACGGDSLFTGQKQLTVPSQALTLTTPIKLATSTTVLSDGFEGAFPGSTWQLFHPARGADVDWGRSSYRRSAGSYSIWCAAAGSASPGPGGSVPVNSESWAFAGPFDLSAATSGELQFDLWMTTEASYDYFFVGASTDGSNFSTLSRSSDTSEWETGTVDLSSFGGAGSIWRTVAGLNNLSAGSAGVTINSGSGVVVYGSLIDNITNDPTTIPFYR